MDAENFTSQVLTPETNAASGAGAPPADQKEPESIRDVLADEFRKDDARKADAAEAKEEPKVEAEEKPEPKVETKPEPKVEAKPAPKVEPKPEAKADGAGEPADADGRKDDDSRNAPARLTDESRGMWRSTPRAIKAEFHRLDSELGRIQSEAREAIETHNSLRTYNDMARQAGTTLKDAMDRYVNFDKALASDFGKGITGIAQSFGKSPQEVIGSILKAYNVTPAQLAQIAHQQPDAFKVAAPAPRDPMLDQIARQQEQIMQRFQMEETRAKTDSMNREVQQWSANKPDFARLTEGGPASPIVQIINSGIIERMHGGGLSVSQRLDIAYRMAGGAISGPAADASEAIVQPQAVPDAGKKSIRGAPNSGLTPDMDDKTTDIRDWLRKEMRKNA